MPFSTSKRVQFFVGPHLLWQKVNLNLNFSFLTHSPPFKQASLYSMSQCLSRGSSPSSSVNDLSMSGSAIQKPETAAASRDRAFSVQIKFEENSMYSVVQV